MSLLKIKNPDVETQLLVERCSKNNFCGQNRSNLKVINFAIITICTRGESL